MPYNAKGIHDKGITLKWRNTTEDMCLRSLNFMFKKYAMY